MSGGKSLDQRSFWVVAQKKNARLNGLEGIGGISEEASENLRLLGALNSNSIVCWFLGKVNTYKY